MQPKEYQRRVIQTVERYLEKLAEARQVYEEASPAARAQMDFAKAAWEAVSPAPYHAKRTGIGTPLPNFCIKVPTGGGKTYLAVMTIDRILSLYRRRQTGLVLWIVPTTQIYEQTLRSLRDRNHPYRQFLDIATGGRVKVVERFERFTPQDIREHLVILMLMLPAANRKDKETLKIFQDAGGFDAFFPPEGNFPAHQMLLEHVPNLDYFGDRDGFFGLQIKTSLGNVLRLVSPIVILDEGQKAYSPGAQGTIAGFNPSIVVELSATPPGGSNVLVSISGRELDQEGMIKLDLHVYNSQRTDWRDVLAESVAWRDALEEEAVRYQANGGEYIRPICLIQVERTGKDQADAGYIHADHVKAELIESHKVPEDQIAIKTSQQNDIENIDLLSSNCPIRYIITKQALQEGWDCSFAYVLTILTNPTSKTALTQLIGRVLRQPYAKKTGVQALDESYVFCYQRRASELSEAVRKGLSGEGLDDLISHVRVESDEAQKSEQRTVGVRERFKPFEGKVYLPRFMMLDGGREREIDYEMDLLSRVDWDKLRLQRIRDLVLSPRDTQDWETAFGYVEGTSGVVEKEHVEYRTKVSLNRSYLTRRLENVVPNPWVARRLVDRALRILRRNYSEDVIAANQPLIAETLEASIRQEVDEACEKIFRELVKQDRLRLVLIAGKAYQVPRSIVVPADAQTLRHNDGVPVQLSLFDDPVPEEWFNEGLERPVALCLDRQEKLLFWFRNLQRRPYFYVQGWRKNKIWADFIATKKSAQRKGDFDTVYVLETKGLHLKDSQDTDYKRRVFELCNELARRTTWDQIGLQFPERIVRFQVVDQDEWETVINSLFS
ncbi:DEAD/DEAH box helicase [Alicyclobacillus acidocaldarius]|uniref:Type III restriction protein res subunit n=1 Tax=Alicyclobacillus acidocaldarius subsp. acidocaldarius (strain ATCC 27009 / DSM 446 / BCRC 14685 / JCM 5260 / KCTC 1825 / NBRC 15652 / NCIMB 11725 / NRRL B-14509 / 104-IA) TaxID=521098 RepID=C8WYI9_ALIAD|nr:DEAD/DEAH box helicase family protein [Alicyclobacillus acidocaldarius]ACV60083.1 type III restriction protein res subunit [Alicyclobacillus acidocaldarius subsp. acidocaldarius DSM 446]